MINIEQDNSIIGQCDYKDFSPNFSTAYPTSRVIDGSRDHGWDQEWAQEGAITLNGEETECTMIFLFDADDVENDDPNYWPWEDRAARIVIE
jgi:hypothetical protein